VVTKPYRWAEGAILGDHTKRKHKILREYFHQYIAVRCQIPQQTKFRLAVVDGFAGAGRYSCGSAGSPIVFIEELQIALDAVNVRRANQDLASIEIECLLIFNDADPSVIELLKSNCAPLLAQIKDTCGSLHLSPHYLSNTFEGSYPMIKRMIKAGRYRNVLYNLDQCGHSKVERSTLVDIMRSTVSAEIFYTFAIKTLLTYLTQNDPSTLLLRLRHLGVTSAELQTIDGLMNRKGWNGAAEKMVFDGFGTCAPFVSPFSINNPDGWRYWLIHFANNYRARQVYNNVLHDNSTAQAHFGRSGLDMLAYDPEHDDGALYLFDLSGRAAAKAQLLDDIPRMVAESGDALNMSEFYESIYNATPAHKDDVHSAIIECSDLEVLTPLGGTRRKANTIEVGDTLKVKTQRSFFPMFLNAAKLD